MLNNLKLHPFKEKYVFLLQPPDFKNCLQSCHFPVKLLIKLFFLFYIYQRLYLTHQSNCAEKKSRHARLDSTFNKCIACASITWTDSSFSVWQEMLSRSLGDSPTLWGFDLFLPPAWTVRPSTDGQQCSIKKHVARHKRCLAALFLAINDARYTQNGRYGHLYQQSFIWPYISFIHLIINIHYIYISKQRHPCPCLAILQ